MRKLPIILTLVLIVAWAYTSWYWYTCNIKGFCDGDTNYSVNQVEENSNSNIAPTLITESKPEEESIDLIEKINNQDEQNSPKLSVDDVLFDPLPKEIEEDNIDQEREEEPQGSETEVVVETENEEEVQSSVEDICSSPLVGPIVFGKDNNVEEVKKLETFLQSRYSDLDTVVGVYDENDFEAMKKFQLEFKAEVLDPWGITTPTGYVGKTSIAKIQQLACK